MKMNGLPPACLLRLQAIYGSLKRAERSAADLLKSDPGFIADASIAEAAQRAQCSQPTFLRLARRLGFLGYAELKNALRSGVVPDVRSEHTPSTRIMSDVLADTLKRATRSFEDAWAVLDPAAFSKVVDVMSRAERVLIFGSGESAGFAEAAAYRLSMAGVNCQRSADPDVQLAMVSMLEPSDVCLILSHSGDARHCIQTARCVKERGATLVAVTSYPYSPIGKLSDILLATLAYDSDSAPMGGLPTMLLLEALYQGLCSLDENREARRRRSEEAQRAGRVIAMRSLRGGAADADDGEPAEDDERISGV